MMEGNHGAPSGGANALGKYRLIAELGHGGMAEVYLAVVQGPAGFNKLVVIKQIRPQLAEDPEFLAMFLDEARLAARLSHPNVVQTNEVGQEGNRYFIAMEYLEGQPLNRIFHRLQKSGGLPLALHVKILSDVLAGLHHAHELADYDGTALEVVHRDVTPHNVFVTYEGQVKVVDFGIAKALNSSAETRTGVLKGKVAYMAPEQARGERCDRRADVFSVGVMLWEAATGRRLWKGVPDITILQRLLAGDIPRPRSINPDAPEAFEAIVLKALSTQREERYATAADFAAALDNYLDEQGERVHARDLAKAVTQAFEADRAKIKSIIEEQLRREPSGRVDMVSLPTLDQHTSPSGGSGSDRNSLSDPSSDKIEIVVGPSSSAPSYTGPSALFATSASTQASQAGGTRSKRGVLLAVALTAGAVLAAVLWQVAKGTPPAPVAAAAATPATASPPVPARPAAATAAAAASVEISISATPPGATIFLDAKPLAGNPAKTTVAKDAMAHEVRIEAAGYATKVDSITFERDRFMDVELVKSAGADAQPHHAAGGPAPPPTICSAP